MGSNMVFYLEDELIERIKKEENRSALVASLLRDYYNKPIIENLEEKKEKIEKEVKELNIIEKEVSEMETERNKRIELSRELELLEVKKKRINRIQWIWEEQFNELLNADRALELVDLMEKQNKPILQIIEDEKLRRKELKKIEDNNQTSQTSNNP